MTDLFLFIFNHIKNTFVFAYDTYTSINIYGNASLWDFIIGIIVVGTIPLIIASAFGASTISSSIGSTVSKSSQIEQRKRIESRNHYKERIH